MKSKMTVIKMPDLTPDQKEYLEIIMTITPDPEYDFVEPLPKDWVSPIPKKGKQCGECGIRFDYGSNMGFSCGNPRCPTSWGI